MPVQGVTPDPSGAPDGQVPTTSSGAYSLATLAAAAVADLNQTIGASPSQAEVQAISDEVDELLASLRLIGLLTS